MDSCLFPCLDSTSPDLAPTLMWTDIHYTTSGSEEVKKASLGRAKQSRQKKFVNSVNYLHTVRLSFFITEMEAAKKQSPETIILELLYISFTCM